MIAQLILAAWVAVLPQLLSTGAGPKPSAGGGGVTWTLVQHPSNFTCSASNGSTTIACTVTASATTAGNALLLLGGLYFENAGATAPSFNAASGDSTWTHCPASLKTDQYASPSWENTDCAYILSAAGGATSFTFTWNVPSTSTGIYADAELLEVHRSTGTASYDTGGVAACGTPSTGVTSCAMANLTLTAADFVAEWAGVSEIPSAPGSPWTNPADVDSSNLYGIFLGALNRPSGALTGPTFTLSSAGWAAVSAVALK